MNNVRYKLLLFFFLTGCQQTSVQPEIALQEQKIQLLKEENERLDNESNALHVRNKKLQRDNQELRVQNARWRSNIMNVSSLKARIDTSFGDVLCELYPNYAPLTVSNFVGFAEGKVSWKDPKTQKEMFTPLYNGTVFHRVIPNFMIQGGDPQGNGTGGPGFQFEDEITNAIKFDLPGRLAMANSGPNTNGSQFFITTSPRPELNGKHTIFGSCLPLDVVNAISKLPTNDNDRPAVPPLINQIVIERN